MSIAMLRMTSTKSVVWVSMPARNCRRLSDSTKESTATAKPSLPSDFRNSTKPCTPNSRFQPFEIEMRDACGRMRSPTNCGRFWNADAPTPATTSSTSRLATALPISMVTMRDSATTSFAVSIGQASGFSRKTERNVPSSTMELPAKKTMNSRMATKEARIPVSRECGSWPFSTVSRIFFSVASSVLLSLSTSSAMAILAAFTPLRCLAWAVRTRPRAPCGWRPPRSPCAP